MTKACQLTSDVLPPNNLTQKGKFIVFEGGEGSGKSTQIPILKKKLLECGIPLAVTREPGGSPGAELIRDLLVKGDTDRWDPWTEVLLYSAARRDHLRSTIWPALDKGTWVLCDRFVDSTVAYQGYGHGLAVDKLENLYKIIANSFQPDLTILLDIPPEFGLKRAAQRCSDDDRFERMDSDFHDRIHQGFHNIAQQNKKRYIIIDATQELEIVSQQIFISICQTFKITH